MPSVPDVLGARRLAVAPDATTGDDVLALARQHIGEEYVLGARAPLTNAGWRGPWDCAEFASWCTFRASGIVYGAEPDGDPMIADAYTGFWARHARERGVVVTVAEAAQIRGALLLREPRTGRTGHIAFSDGGGGTVEAHSTRRGVCASVAGGRRWDMGVLVPGIRYFRSEEVVDLEPEPRVLRLTHPMTRGPRVLRVQRALARLGYHVGAADGIFGPQTADALHRFQHDAGLVPDGEVGPATWQALALD